MHFVIVLAAAFAAGAINSVAGGGTLITFPTLVWLGLPAKVANGTSTVALWPGSLGGMWGYRRELKGTDRRIYLLAVPSLVGGIGGAILLQLTPTDLFNRLIPFLILFATVLFWVQEPIQRRFNAGASPHDRGRQWLVWTLVFQLGVGLYGGYFGAGIGILMLAALGVMGFTDIHQMNGVKNLLALTINGIAAAYFIHIGLVLWQDAIVMMGGSILGGVGGAGLARRLGRPAVRRIVVIIGLFMAASMLFRL